MHVRNTQGDGTSLSPSTFRVNTAQGDSHDHDSDEDADGDHGGGGGGAPTVASGAAVCRLPWLGRPVGFTALPSPGAVVGFEDASCVLQVCVCVCVGGWVGVAVPCMC